VSDFSRHGSGLIFKGWTVQSLDTSTLEDKTSDTSHPVTQRHIPAKRRPQPTAAKIPPLQSLVATVTGNKVDMCTDLLLHYIITVRLISMSSSVTHIIMVSTRSALSYDRKQYLLASLQSHDFHVLASVLKSHMKYRDILHRLYGLITLKHAHKHDPSSHSIAYISATVTLYCLSVVILKTK